MTVNWKSEMGKLQVKQKAEIRKAEMGDGISAEFGVVSLGLRVGEPLIASNLR